ncbi:signal peptidase I [Candidatus Roizmanbacteria bacterium]|nr:signal peptidase I [Candidatus Roizmanbacteria bacterium]
MRVIKVVIDFVMDILETIVFIGSLFIVIYLFVAQPNLVKGVSMEPTFQTNDYILTSKVTYRIRPMHRGDIVVFKSPRNPDIDYIKRIIALPGDNILVRNGNVFVNDELINEPYIAARTNLWGEGGFLKEGVSLVIPPENVFVMGDNRPHSSDSREFGYIPLSSIIGQVFYRYFPPTKAHWLKNPWPKNRQTKLGLQIADFFLPLAKLG